MGHVHWGMGVCLQLAPGDLSCVWGYAKFSSALVAKKSGEIWEVQQTVRRPGRDEGDPGERARRPRPRRQRRPTTAFLTACSSPRVRQWPTVAGPYAPPPATHTRSAGRAPPSPTLARMCCWAGRRAAARPRPRAQQLSQQLARRHRVARRPRRQRTRGGRRRGGDRRRGGGRVV